MTLQIRSLSGELREDEKKLIRKKFLWFEEHLPNSCVLTVGVREHITKRSNQAHEIILHLTIPDVKKPIYVKVFANSFVEAVDIARAKLERIVLRRKEKGFRFRFKPPRLNFFRRKNEGNS
jgi:ribosome-associated translation inhibitor RaiA